MTAPGIEDGKRYAYYAADWIWPCSLIDYMKQMLLFFDGIAMSLPTQIFYEAVDQDPVLALPLLERGLLINADPIDVIDPVMYELLPEAILEIADAVKYWNSITANIAKTHLGRPLSPVFESMTRRLIERGIIEKLGEHYAYGGVVSVSEQMREVMLYLYAQALYASTPKLGRWPTIEPVRLHEELDLRRLGPVIDELNYPAKTRVKIETLSTRSLNVPLDLSLRTIDDVLEFRDHNARDLRQYMKALKSYARELAASDNPDAVRAERDQEIDDYNSSLRARTKYRDMRASLSVGISILGATWTMQTGNTLGALISLLGAAAGIPRNEAIREVTSYSYLAKIERRFA